MRDVIFYLFLVIGCTILSVLVVLDSSGNLVTDHQKEFLHQAREMKRECEMTLPRTEHCVLQFVPAQQKD